MKSPKKRKLSEWTAQRRAKEKAEWEAVAQARGAQREKERAENERKAWLPDGEGYQSALFFLSTRMKHLQRALGLLSAGKATPGLARAVYGADDALHRIYYALHRANRKDACDGTRNATAPNVVPLFVGAPEHTPGGLAS